PRLPRLEWIRRPGHSVCDRDRRPAHPDAQSAEDPRMKIAMFHLMPYRWLPADFDKRHHSVWVDIPSSLFDPEKGHQMYNQSLDELEYAAQLGYDGICVNEHHSNAYGMMPSPNLMAATLARRTRDVAIIIMGNSI